MQMKCFQVFNSLWQRIPSATGLQYRAPVAPMTGKSSGLIGGELWTDMLVVISVGLQIHKNTARTRRHKWSLTSKIYFQHSKLDSTADAGSNTVPVVSAR